MADQTCIITVHNNSGHELDEGMCDFAMRIAGRHLPQAAVIDVYAQPRLASGWLEWAVSIRYRSGGKLYIGCIQREPGATYESHT